MLETIAIGFTSARSDEIRRSSGLCGSVRNLLYYVHQNFLTLTELLLARVPPAVDCVSSWLLLGLDS